MTTSWRAAGQGAHGRRGGSFESEDNIDYEDEEQREARQRLIRTVLTVDWFRAPTANEVSGNG